MQRQLTSPLIPFTITATSIVDAWSAVNDPKLLTGCINDQITTTTTSNTDSIKSVLTCFVGRRASVVVLGTESVHTAAFPHQLHHARKQHLQVLLPRTSRHRIDTRESLSAACRSV